MLAAQSAHTAQTCNSCQALGTTIKQYLDLKQDNSTFRGIEEIFPKNIRLGTLGEIRKRSHCHFCQMFAQSITHKGSKREAKIPVELHSEYAIFDVVVPMGEVQYAEEVLQFIPLETDSDFGCGRLVDANWINIQQLRKWIFCCDQSHKDQCHPLLKHRKLSLPQATNLLDVRRGCLVSASGQETYVALSYVWGKAANLTTRKSNIKQHQKPGMLTTGNPLLPETIKDAMRLTQALGQDYLWVDALCITQDDDESKHSQINNMGFIYSSAYLTVIAAQGSSADYGIHGVGSGSQPRSFQQTVFELHPGQKMLRYNMLSHGQSVWSSRAWTWQELKFSLRKLVFVDEAVYWECPCARWQEDRAQAEEDPLHPMWTGQQYDFETVLALGEPAAYPDVSDYSGPLAEYTSRQLSFDCDALAAFAGYSTVLSKSFPGGLHFGLPEMFFDEALLWQPSDPLRRREAPHPATGANTLPSWSWAGWEGEIIPLRLSAFHYLRLYRPVSSETRQIVKWYKVSKSSHIQSLISNSSQTYRHLCTDIESPLPEGWTRDGVVTRSAKHCFFKHQLAGEQEFRYPIPIVTAPGEVDSKEWSSHLFGTVSRAWLRIRSRIHHRRPDSHCLCVSLVDNQDNWAGILNLNLAASESSPADTSCELIAISLGYACNNPTKKSFEYSEYEEWDLPERPISSQFYWYYNVLWIGWQGNIAFRRASGRVPKEVWDMQDLETLQITLG